VDLRAAKPNRSSRGLPHISRQSNVTRSNSRAPLSAQDVADLYKPLDQPDLFRNEPTPTPRATVNADFVGRRCRCGGQSFVTTGPSIGPNRHHHDGVRCVTCDAHCGWLTKAQAAQIHIRVMEGTAAP
jgi:hypothetical protein